MWPNAEVSWPLCVRHPQSLYTSQISYLWIRTRWLRTNNERPFVDYQRCIWVPQAILLIWMRQLRSIGVDATHESSILFVDCTAAFSPLWPTLKELIFKFIFSTVSSRTGSMSFSFTEALSMFRRRKSRQWLAVLASLGNLRGFLRTSCLRY